MRDNNDTVLAFFLGAVTGAVAALLLAPQSGQETREAIRRGADNIRNRSTDALSTAKDAVTRKTQEYTEGARARMDAVKEAASEAKAVYRREMERSND